MPRVADDHGEYDTDAGSTAPLERGDTHPRTGKEIKYDPCNAVLKFTWERYGEIRYCTGLAVSNFGDAANYEHGQFCKHHQSRKALMDHHKDSFKTGAFAKSYEHVFQYLPPHKQVVAVELFRSLMGESSYEFSPESIVHEVDTSDSDFADMDSINIDFPVPTEHIVRGQALWYAALDFVKMQNITEEQFRVAHDEDLAVGEKEFERESESGQVYTVVDEHHLNMPLSRIQKDYSRHLKFGGVEVDSESSTTEIEDRTWVIEIDQPEPEAASGTSPMADIEIPDE